MIKDFYELLNVGVWLKVVTGVVLSILGFFFDALLAKIFLIVITLTLIDCILGYFRAFKRKDAVVSRVMYKYGVKFSGYMISASSLYLMSNAMPHEVQFVTGWLDNFALAFFAVHETISIIEHLNELGVPLPTKLLGNLYKIKDTIDDDERLKPKPSKAKETANVV